MTSMLNEYVDNIMSLSNTSPQKFAKIFLKLVENKTPCPTGILKEIYDKYDTIDKIKIACMLPKEFVNEIKVTDNQIYKIRYNSFSYVIIALFLGVNLEDIYENTKNINLDNMIDYIMSNNADMPVSTYNVYLTYLFYRFNIFDIDEMRDFNIKFADIIYEYINADDNLRKIMHDCSAKYHINKVFK